MDPNNASSPIPTQTPIPTQAPQPPAPQGGKFGFLKDPKKKKLAGIIAAGVILVGGGVAGAYYGIIVPNQPQNVLKKSVENLLSKDQISGKGKASFSDGGGSGAGTVEYSLQTDSTKNAMAGTFDVAFSGVKLPLEARVVDKAAYVKVGDLSTIESLVSSFVGPESSAVVNQLSAKVSNKWIEFDESLLKTATQDECSILSDQQKISEDQVKKLLEIYDQNMFVDIKNTSSDTVDGKKVTKAELGLDKSKAQAFAKEAEKLDYFKKFKDCAGGSTAETESQAVEDFKGDASFTIWVDKGKKEIVKVQLNIKEDKATFEADFTFNNDAVNIAKPEGAIPAMQLYSELIPLFSAGLMGGAATTGGTGGATDLNASCSDAITAYVQAGTPLPPECEALYGN